MQKDSNNNIYGWPEYLKRFKYKNNDLPKILAKEVLEGKFDFDAENKLL
jgi:hypothetical protein